MPNTIPPAEALRRLIAGNKTHASGTASNNPAHNIQRHYVIDEQRPFGIILGCSDSRVPVEVVFNQTIGNLFVIRVAGYVLNDHVLGSIEYAVQTFGSSLLMVLGHSHCGAVTAAVDAVLENKTPASRVGSIVEQIRPAVQSVRGEKPLVEAAIKAHVRAIVDELTRDTVLRPSIAAGNLAVVGTEYHLETGLVQILTPEAMTPPIRSTARAAE